MPSKSGTEVVPISARYYTFRAEGNPGSKRSADVSPLQKCEGSKVPLRLLRCRQASRRNHDFLSHFNPLTSIQSRRSNLFFYFSENALISAHSDSPEGRCASSRVVGRDAVDTLRPQDERQQRGRPRDSQDVTASLTIQCEIATTRMIETRVTGIAGPLVNARVSGGRVTVRA